MAIGVAGAAFAVVLSGPPAAATAPTTVTVTAGSAADGTTVGFTATSGGVLIKDFTTGFGWSCSSSRLTSWSTKAGSGQGPNGTPAGTGLAQFPGGPSDVSFSNCTRIIGSAGFPFTLAGASATGSPWRFKADSLSDPANTPASSGQRTSGTLYNMNLKWTSNSCSFNVTGSASSTTYTNGTQPTLTLPTKQSAAESNLVVSNFVLRNGAASCMGGMISGNGDRLSLATTYMVSANNAAQNPIWINAT